MQERADEVQIGGQYPFGQMAKAFVTALTHADDATRQRAESRVEKWRSVLEGMTSGRLSIGSRAPVQAVPAWVTPEVLRGGFATGSPAAGGRLEPFESEFAKRAGARRLSD